MLRDKWEFKYTVSAILTAAEKKMNHHAERLKWWEEKQEEIIKEAKESGISINTAVGAEYGASNVMRGAIVSVDEKYQIKLSECYHKIIEHRNKKEAYAGWYTTLNALPPADSLKLHSDDYLYFFTE